MLLFVLLGVLLAMQSVQKSWPRVVMTIIVIGYSAILIIDYQYDIYIGKIEQDEIAVFIHNNDMSNNNIANRNNWLINATENYLRDQKKEFPFPGSFYQYLSQQNQQQTQP